MVENKAEKRVVKIVITLEGQEAGLYLKTIAELELNNKPEVLGLFHKTAFVAGIAKTVGAAIEVMKMMGGTKQ